MLRIYNPANYNKMLESLGELFNDEWWDKRIEAIADYYRENFVSNKDKFKLSYRLDFKNEGNRLAVSNGNTINICYKKVITIVSGKKYNLGWDKDSYSDNDVYEHIFEYLLAREMFITMFLANDADVSSVTDALINVKSENCLYSMAHYFVFCYLFNVRSKRALDFTKYILEQKSDIDRIGEERTYYRGGNLFILGEKSYSGKAKIGREFPRFETIVKLYNEGKYAQCYECFVNRRYEPIEKNEYDAFREKYHPNNILRKTNAGEKRISALEKEALLFFWDNASMFTKIADYYYVDKSLVSMYQALHRFMETGSKNDAFDVYCCYSSLFLVGDKMQELINFISSYESNASRLVNSHRDHYSHSVYVFIIGLAIYHSKKIVRDTYREKYKLGKLSSVKMIIQDDKEENRHEHYLRLWGLTALFHDIGYQFEIPFTQITGNTEFYFDDTKCSIFYHYENLDKYTNLRNFFESLEGEIWNMKELVLYKADGEDYITEYIKALVSNESDKTDVLPESINDVIAYHIYRSLGRDYLDVSKISEDLAKKRNPIIIEPNKSKGKLSAEYYMDHAYYSAILIFKQLIRMFGIDKFLSDITDNAYKSQSYIESYGADIRTDSVRNEWMDAITAIAMHNKFFENYLKQGGGSLRLEEHPLAYMLILCDELQCWDRTSFGKSSIRQLHAMDCEFDFSDYDENVIRVTFIYDEHARESAIEFDGDGKISSVKAGSLVKFYKDGKKNFITPNEFKADDPSTWIVSEHDCKFRNDIGDIVSITDNCEIILEVGARFSEGSKYKKEYLSETSMRHLYGMAEDLYREMKISNETFEYADLEIKLSYIQFVKTFGEALHEIGCFYSNQPKAFEVKEDFSEAEKAVIVDVEKKNLEDFCLSNMLNIDEYDIGDLVEKFTELMLDRDGIVIYKL